MDIASIQRLGKIGIPLALILGGLAIGGGNSVSAEPSTDTQRAERQIREETAVSDSGPHAFGRSLKNLRSEHWMPMREGKKVFVHGFQPAGEGPSGLDGLGPLFNADSCSACHFRDGRGRRPQAGAAFQPDPSPLPPLIFRLSHGSDDRPHPQLGRQLQDRRIKDGGNPAAEGRMDITYRPIQGTYPDGETFTLSKPHYRWTSTEPPADTHWSPRVSPTLVGMGLLEAVPSHEILNHHDPDDFDGDGISGRARWVRDQKSGRQSLGRFGWKAAQPSLRSQTRAALRHDMGIEEDEIHDPYFDSIILYLRLLAPPAQRQAQNPSIQQGEQLFLEIGCGSCHRPTLTTGSADQIEGPSELANQRIRPYTDLLLHDLGPGLADASDESGATGREWRTAPLWGLGLLEQVNGRVWLLHDGRARTFEEAILWHGGEGRAARDRFAALSAQQRKSLLQFLDSL